MQSQKVLKICLMVVLGLILISCAPHFPEVHPYILSLKNGQCGEYKQTPGKPTDFIFVKWHQIAECEGFFALPAQDVANVRAWYDTNYGPKDPTN